MLNLRVRLVKDDGSTDRTSRVLNTKTVSYAVDLNGAGTLDFSVSRNDFVPEVMPFLVRVEYSDSPAGPYKPLPEHELFIVESDSDDSLDEGQVVTYKAVAFVPWLLGGAYVGTGPWQKNNTRTINGEGHKSNAGQILSYFIDESKTRGWLPALRRTFNSNTDSAGVAWKAEDRDEIAWTLETFYPKVLEQMSEQHMCDWSAQGNAIHLYRPGTKGRDRSQLVFGGAGFTRVPVTTDVTGWYTHVIALSDAGRVHVDNRPAEARFGRRSIAMTQTGVKDVGTSTRLARDLLADGQKVKREEVFEWTPTEGGLYPFRDFLLGDLVTALARGGRKHKRVFGVQVEQDIDGAKVQVRIGDQLTSAAIKAGKVLGSVAVGGVVGGSGGSFPTSPPLPEPVPLAPDALRVTHNEGSWGPNGNAVIAVGLEWAKVTEAVDGSEVDISEYQVWSRTPSGERTLDATVAGISQSVEITSWVPDQHRLVSVRARAANGGKWSDYSLEVAVMPEYPGELIPKAPENLKVVSNVGSWSAIGPMSDITLSWDAVTETTTGEPTHVNLYEVWVDGIATATSPTTSLTVQVAPGAEREYTVRARAGESYWSDPAYPRLKVIGAEPGTPDMTPTPPTLRTGYGVVVAAWDGLLAAGETSALLGVQAYFSIDEGPEAPMGSVLTKAGTATISASAGDEVHVRLEAIDRLGRVAGTTTLVTITAIEIDGEDIKADTIEGNKIKVGTIYVDQLAPNVGDDLNLSANGAITLIVGRQDEQDGLIAEAKDAADRAEDTAGGAKDEAARADAAAREADGKALVAQQMARDNTSDIKKQQSVFRVTSTGAEISSIDGSNLVEITPTGVSIVQGGVVASTWDAGRLIVSEGVFSRAQVGNHILEKSGQRTVVRPLYEEN